jgi:hypothetical protein
LPGNLRQSAEGITGGVISGLSKPSQNRWLALPWRLRHARDSTKVASNNCWAPRGATASRPVYEHRSAASSRRC